MGTPDVGIEGGPDIGAAADGPDMGGADMGGPDIGGADMGAEGGDGTATLARAVPDAVEGAGADPGVMNCADAPTAPWATTSSGCSTTVGARPSAWCSSVATSGMRLPPPTRNTPCTSAGVRPAAAIAERVDVTVAVRMGPASCWNWSRPSGTS